MKSIDQFLGRQPKPGYNCLDFVREVWRDGLGREDVCQTLTGLQGAFAGRRANISGVKSFRRLKGPANPCFVVMQRFRCVPHVGIWLDGRILHLTDKGVQFQPLIVARAYFTGIRYYL